MMIVRQTAIAFIKTYLTNFLKLQIRLLACAGVSFVWHSPLLQLFRHSSFWVRRRIMIFILGIIRKRGSENFCLGCASALAIFFSFIPAATPALAQQNCANFIRGDANADKSIDIGDPVFILFYLFQGTATPPCLEAANVDGDKNITLTDAIYLLTYLFRNGPAPQPLDTIVPVVSSLTPAAGSFIASVTPSVSAEFSDDQTGIDVSSVRIFIDGIDLTGKASITSTGLTLVLTSALTEGGHLLTLQLKDQAGNAVEKTNAFSVDVTPPLITGLLPPNSSATSMQKPTFSATFSDNLAGVDLTSLTVTLDGENITSQTAKAVNGFSYTVSSPLAEGSHVLKVTLRDKAGTLTQAQSTFIVDIGLPVISNIIPASQAVIGEFKPLISGQYTDSHSGIDKSAVAIFLNGEDLTAVAVISETGFSLSPPVVLANNVHELIVRVKDKAGTPAESISTFTVDTSGPILKDLVPADQSFVNSVRPSISVNLIDLGSRDPSQVTFLVDDAVCSPGSLLYTGNFIECMFGALAQGPHTVTFSVTDFAGNTAQQTNHFIIDSIPPSVTNLQPADGSQSNNPRPGISAQFSDNASGIEIEAFELWLDDQDMSAQASVSVLGFSFQPNVNLMDGTHTVTARIKDRAGSLTEKTTSFTTDASGPVVSNLLPAHNGFIATTTPTISAQFSDPGGIRLNSIKVFIDGTDRTAQSNVTVSALTLAVTPALASGSHNVRLELSDTLGNLTQVTNSFTVDAAGPAINNLVPAQGSVVPLASPVISAQLSDNAAGIDTASLSAVLDGQELAALAAVTQTGFTLPVAAALNAGNHTLTIRIKDEVGNETQRSVTFSTSKNPGIVSGPINVNTVWTAAASPYIVRSDVTVAAGVTLTIEPGVEVRFDGNYKIEVNPLGTLSAQGTSTTPVQFTSNKSLPAKGDWSSLVLSGTSVLLNTIVEYSAEGVAVSKNSAVVSNNLIRKNGKGILLGLGSAPVLSNNVIIQNDYGIFANYDGTSFTGRIENNQVYENGQYNFYCFAQISGPSVQRIDAANNWWGTADPQEILRSIQDGVDDVRNPLVRFTPYLDGPAGQPVGTNYLYGHVTADMVWTRSQSPYVVITDITVLSATTLTLEPGVEIRYGGPYQLTVQGTLNAVGQPDNLIKLTSHNVVPEPADWNGVRFLPGSSGVIRYTLIEYAQTGLATQDTSITFENSVVRGNAIGFMSTGASASSIQNNLITANQDYGIFLSGGPTPEVFFQGQIHGSNIYGNGKANLFIEQGRGGPPFFVDARSNWWGSADYKIIMASIVDFMDKGTAPTVLFTPFLDAPGGNQIGGRYVYGALPGQTTWSPQQSPYIVIADVTVAHLEDVLTILPGTEIRFDGKYRLLVGGKLDAQGLPGNQIKFTSNKASPRSGDWQGIEIGVSNDSGSVIKNAVIEYAENGISMQAASPIIDSNSIRRNIIGVNIVNHSVSAITNNTVTENTDTGIRIVGGRDSSVYFQGRINGNAIYNNANFNLRTAEGLSSFVINARNNWWGTTDIFQIHSKIYDYLDTTNQPVVDFSGYLNAAQGTALPVFVESGDITSNKVWRQNETHLLIRDVVVNSGVTLTIEPGVTVNFLGPIGLTANGTLNAQGTAASLIRFTSDEGRRLPGSWKNISLGTSSTVAYAQIEFATEGLKSDGTAPHIHHNIFRENNYGLFILNGSAARVTNNRFSKNNYGIYVSPSLTSPPRPVIANNELENNKLYNLYAGGEEDFSTQVITAENNWWGSPQRSAVAATIFDKNDNPTSPLVDFEPFTGASSAIGITNVSASRQFFDPEVGQSTTIRYTLAVEGNVTVRIFDFKTNRLTRTLVSAQPRPAGANSEIWDGKDNTAMPVMDGVYYYSISIADAQNQVSEYDPVYISGPVQVLNARILPAQFNPYKGETALVQFDLLRPAMVSVNMGSIVHDTPFGNLIQELVVDVPRNVNNNQVFWDGRDTINRINTVVPYVPPVMYTAAVFANLLPDNGIVVQRTRVLSIDMVEVQPFIIHTLFGGVTNIKYSISRDARVSVQIKRPPGEVIRTLAADEFKTSGTYNVLWNGQDNSGRILAQPPGNYLIAVTAVDAATGKSVTRHGSVMIY